MTFAASIANTAVGAGLQAVGTMFSHGGGTSVYKTNKIATHNMNLNKQYTQWLNENGYSQMRKGLETANYNPMLAVGATPQQGSVASSPATESNAINPLNAVAAMNTAANTHLQEQQAETEIAKRENLKADTGVKLVDKLYKDGLIKWQDRQQYADMVMKHTTSMLNTANAKYNNERARGFSESKSYSGNLGGNVAKRFGVNAGGSYSSAKTY